MNKFLLNIFILILGILAGSLIYYYSFQNVLVHNCLLNSKNCMRIRYKQLRNTVLVELPNYYWVWFNGAELFVYGYPTTKECTEGHEVAFVLNSEDLALKGFQCAMSLDRIFKMYENISFNYYFLSTLPCINEKNSTQCNTHIGCIEKSSCVNAGETCQPGSGCQVTTIGAVDIINLLLEEGIIQKTHIIDKNYIQPNPHSPSSPTASPTPKVPPGNSCLKT